MKTAEQRTYQTRFFLPESAEQALSDMASLLSQTERSLISQISRGEKASSLKSVFLKKFQITARQFNACRVNIEGKAASFEACRDLHIDTLKHKKKKLELQCKDLSSNIHKRFHLHQKKRTLDKTSRNLEKILEEKKAKRVSICCGSRRLFKAQFHLDENGFSSHEEWKDAWRKARNSEFFLLGSKDENMGNQSCVASIQEDGKIALSIRIPPALESKYGKHIVLKDLDFSYGHEAILASLEENLSRKWEKKNKQSSYKNRGQAICYRFKKDDKGWRVFVTTALEAPKIESREHSGVIGIDVNANHIDCVETDRYGNPVQVHSFAWNTYGKSNKQAKAITGDLCKKVVDWALQTKKPLVIENLDFKKKKKELASSQKKHARMLSSFSYGLFRTLLQARAYRLGIAVHLINPAYTSVIGSVKFAARYGLSTHLSAALCIGRRHQGFSEQPNSHEGKIPDGKGLHVTFVLPVRNRMKHVWSFWAGVKKKIPAVLAAHFQAIKHRSLSPPLSTT